MGSLPLGLTSPNRTFATAGAPSLPAYQASTTAADFFNPRHQDGGAGFKHDDGARIRGCDLVDQRILIVGEGKIRQVHAFTRPLIDKYDGYVGLTRQRSRGSGIAA